MRSHTPLPLPTEHSDLAAFLSARGYIALRTQRSAVGHFEIEALINGIPALLLIDTGASMTVIDEKSAQTLALPLETAEEKAGGLGVADLTISRGIIDHLKIDTLTLEHQEAYVMNLSHVNQALEARNARRADGIIGADILNSYAAIIDYSDAIVYLQPIQAGKSASSHRMIG